jgi:uncharacterized protein involved in response to NO
MNLSAPWKAFSAAPHRMFFFGGVMQSMLTLLWWLIDLGGRYGGLYTPVAWVLSPTDTHAWLMIYGFFPFFVFGFLMTTYPRWMNGEEVERKAYVPAFLLLSAGGLVFYVGLVIDVLLVKIALTLFLAGWGMGLYGLLRVYIRAKHPDKRHASITSAVLTLGWMLMVGFTFGSAIFIELAKVGGIWVVLLPVFFAVSHRMIPFFSANVIVGYQVVRPGWALILVPVGALLHAVLELAGMLPWLWLADLPMAAGAICLTYAWRLHKSLAVPILGMLHIGFAWLGIALLLFSAQSLVLLTTGQWLLAKAPLHALTIGYFTSMLLAMATRVTLGHSGRLLAADRLTWGVFLAFQLVVVLRIVSELPGLRPETHNLLYLGAAAAWLVCFGIWSWKYAPIYWKPRPDGRPG